MSNIKKRIIKSFKGDSSKKANEKKPSKLTKDEKLVKEIEDYYDKIFKGPEPEEGFAFYERDKFFNEEYQEALERINKSKKQKRRMGGMIKKGYGKAMRGY